MYSEKARKLRQCQAICIKNGKQCLNYSRLDSNFCGLHLGKNRGRPKNIHRVFRIMKRQAQSRKRHPSNICKCKAYNFPHRAGGGLCRWPDPPLERLTTPSGTRSEMGKLKKELREMGCSNPLTRSINYERQGEIVEIDQEKWI